MSSMPPWQYWPNSASLPSVLMPGPTDTQRGEAAINAVLIVGWRHAVVLQSLVSVMHAYMPLPGVEGFLLLLLWGVKKLT